MKSVLITGGSGSFGQAFSERLLKDPTIERIAILSRGEHAQAEMAGRLNDKRLRFFIGDVRDRERLRRAFADIEVVVHAAALKRIEVGHHNPIEMVKTNVDGAINVVEAALDAGVKKVVALSTDKAYQPISPYGQTKALAESIFLNAYQGRTQFSVTRYGNVAGSKGSVIPKWSEILRTADTVPVTDPEVTRFYMTMDHAVHLVMRAIEIMPTITPLIPVLPAYRLGDLAEAMGAKMNIIGLPEYEKRHEGMCDGNTSDKARRMSVEELRGVLNEDGLHRPSADWKRTPSRQGSPAPEWAYSNWGSSFEVPAHRGC
jgi:UDP-N-acetylglucosamine 4,6-dehydratase